MTYRFDLLVSALAWLCCDIGTLVADVFQRPPESDAPGLSPSGSLRTMHTHADLKVELVASEPLVVDPVAIDWGLDGSLWVVEMRDYPLGMDGKGAPGGRVKWLKDSNSDGSYDVAHVFLDNLPFPTAVKVWRRGVLVIAAPDLIYAEDTDGDGVADRRETVFTGFGVGNQQHAANGLRWGLDNWLHVANGDNGGIVRLPHAQVGRDIRGRDVRLRPRLGQLELESGRTHFGLNRDDWGNWFGCANNSPLWHRVLPNRYIARNPHIQPGVKTDVLERQTVIFPRRQKSHQFHPQEQPNRFTSACSAMIYRDHLLGAEFAGNAFVCEPAYNLVHRAVLSEEGVSFSAKRAGTDRKQEFLSSADPWFRPTMIRTGPDGALWIVDMYRLVIEHPQWIPAAWHDKIAFRAGSCRGRIYRVYPKATRVRDFPLIQARDPSRLLALLAHPNGWVRDMAHQLLVCDDDPGIESELRQLARESPSAIATLHALCVLDGMGATDEEILISALEHSHPGIRKHAIRLSERFAEAQSTHLEAALADCADDPSEVVRLQLAFTLGAWRSARLTAALGRIIARHSDRHFMFSAAMSSLAPDNLRDVAFAALRESHPSDRVVIRLFRMAVAWQDKPVMSRLLTRTLRRATEDNSAWPTLAYLLKAMHTEGVKVKDFGEESSSMLERVLVAARLTAASRHASDGKRAAAIGLLGNQELTEVGDVEIVAALLSHRTSPLLRANAVSALGQMDHEEIATVLLEGWNQYTPPTREQVGFSLLRRQDRIGSDPC